MATRFRHAKADARLVQGRESAIRVEADATLEMAAVAWEESSIFFDQYVLMFFIVSKAALENDQACEYLRLQRGEEMDKLKCWLEEKKFDAAKVAEAAKAEENARLAEVAKAVVAAVAALIRRTA